MTISLNQWVSIIIPVYGVQDHVKKCMQSLLSQTYPHIEYIIVDDCCQDNSMSIIRQLIQNYPERVANIKILEHQKNRGLPAARNTGLQESTGNYIFHCDSDDWIEPSMIANMVLKSENEKSDITYCDFYLSFHKNERYMNQPSITNSHECIRAMLNGSMKFNVWNKLIKKELYIKHSILFPEGKNMGEDMTIIKLFCHATKISYIPAAYYHYVQTNANAYTKQISDEKLLQIQHNIADVIKYLKNIFGVILFKKEFEFFKLNMKLHFLISLDTKMYDLWNLWYPEANDYIAENPAFSQRARLIQYAAIKRQYWFIKLYNLIVIRFVYGLLYR